MTQNKSRTVLYRIVKPKFWVILLILVIVDLITNRLAPSFVLRGEA